MRKSCEDCRWWGAERAHILDMPIGRCRVSAPRHLASWTTVTNSDGKTLDLPRGEWVWTAFDDWCAEHSTRAE